MIDQIAIALTGATAVWCSQDHRESVRRWACILGTIGQPFWFYAAYQNCPVANSRSNCGSLSATAFRLASTHAMSIVGP